MRRATYLQMLSLIDMYHTWVVADDGHGYGQCVVFRRGRLRLCACRVLRLRSLYRHGGYKGGTVWRISEFELDKALARYRKTNHDAKRRLKQGASFLGAGDVEAIIETATHGLVKPELTGLPLFKP